MYIFEYKKARNEFYHTYFFSKDGAFHVNRPSPKFVSAAHSSSAADGAVAPMTGTIVKVSNQPLTGVCSDFRSFGYLPSIFNLYLLKTV